MMFRPGQKETCRNAAVCGLTDKRRGDRRVNRARRQLAVLVTLQHSGAGNASSLRSSPMNSSPGVARRRHATTLTAGQTRVRMTRGGPVFL